MPPRHPEPALHWRSSETSRIPNTAIEADCSKQNFTTIPVTHYFDELRTCQGCRAPFIFFAAEQKHWYEELGFPLEADCVRCVFCRKQQQLLAQHKKRYEELFHQSNLSLGEKLEMAECCLSLIEAGLFSPRKTTHVRALLEGVSEQRGRRLRRRLLAIEKSADRR